MARPCETDADGFCPEHGNDCDDFRLHLRQEAEQTEDPETRTEELLFVEVVNWSGSRRHLATPKGHPSKGQIKTFCPNTWGQTFESHAERRSQWTDKALDYAALPLCRTCAKLVGIDPGPPARTKAPARIFRVESMGRDRRRWWGTFSSVERAQAAIAEAEWKPGVHRIVNRLTGEVVVDYFDD